jgi:hypothetical protein
MFDDRYTEITHESWFSRIVGAIAGILVGLILFGVSFPLLFLNEGCAVQGYKTLREGGGAVVSVPADRIEPANAGKLIHLTGTIDTEAILTDSVFGVSVNALKLRRDVKMYQWQETTDSRTQKKLGGSTETIKTYRYSPDWYGMTIRSEEFKDPIGHQNPGTMPYESHGMTADEVRLGAFRLSPSLLWRISDFTPLVIDSNIPVPWELSGRAEVHNYGFYIGDEPSNPQIGDIRVRFEAVKATEATVIAKQVNDSLEAYPTKAGGTILLLKKGIYPADAMMQMEQQERKLWTWILRVVGFFVMFIGLNLIFKPLSVFADVLPILGDIVGLGTGLIAFLLAAILSMTTISIAWIVHRPLLAVLLLAVGVGLTAIVIVKLIQARSTA